MCGNGKKCVTCPYFKIMYYPVKFLENGLACCNNYDMEVGFKSEKQLQKLKCIEPTNLEDQMKGKDWENIEKYFLYTIPKK